jgi:hypothetical protein
VQGTVCANLTSLTTLLQVIAASRRLICDISEEEKRRELKDIADVYATNTRSLVAAFYTLLSSLQVRPK